MAARYWEICTELARHFAVTLAAPVVERAADRGFQLIALDDRRGVRDSAVRSEILIAPLDILPEVPWVLSQPGIVCIDLIWPKILEDLERREVDGSPGTAELAALQRAELQWTGRALQRADLLLCGSERQRDFWLGWLGAAGRLNRATHAADPDFTGLVRVVATGMPRETPPDRSVAARAVWPGIAPDDFLVLWGGGVWDWTDPFTPLRAMQRLLDRDPAIKLLYVGLTPPTPGATLGQTAGALVREAERLGLAGRTVFVQPGWTPRDQFHRWLRAADVGISFHKRSLESRFSVRTRLLDYLWAGLPVVATAGDTMGDLTERHGLGMVVPPENDQQLAEVLLALRHSPQQLLGFRQGVEAFAPQWSWDRVCRPLVEFCGDPRPRSDTRWVCQLGSRPSALIGAVQRKVRLLRTQGLRAAAADVALLRRLKRRLFG
jgi:hypothetical protein